MDHLNIPSENIIGLRDEELEYQENYVDDLKKLISKKKLKMTGQDGLTRIDLTLLGIGTDGHIAAHFPHSSSLHDTSSWVCDIRNCPRPPSNRISLGLHVINNSRKKYVALVGASKSTIASLVIKGRPSENRPASLLKGDV